MFGLVCVQLGFIRGCRGPGGTFWGMVVGRWSRLGPRKNRKKSKIFIFPKSFPNHILIIFGGVWRWETRCLGSFASNLGFIRGCRGPGGAFLGKVEAAGARKNMKKIKKFYFPQIAPKSYPDHFWRGLEVGNALFGLVCVEFGVHVPPPCTPPRRPVIPFRPGATPPRGLQALRPNLYWQQVYNEQRELS